MLADPKQPLLLNRLRESYFLQHISGRHSSVHPLVPPLHEALKVCPDNRAEGLPRRPRCDLENISSVRSHNVRIDVLSFVHSCKYAPVRIDHAYFLVDFIAQSFVSIGTASLINRNPYKPPSITGCTRARSHSFSSSLKSDHAAFSVGGIFLHYGVYLAHCYLQITFAKLKLYPHFDHEDHPRSTWLHSRTVPCEHYIPKSSTNLRCQSSFVHRLLKRSDMS